ncbi:uncharacterized protein LOC118742602 isoform X1 [Rhagoletis pomonella]|uniref:uncharacterized protein LOC118742602 isoform X1 n=1 Tax=Rhagoletis pomonella TaxID=28610 RepID=UPI00178374FD|nr:uncharacterized protein LOC118742602 isoform X1 [Rhagoletis pomonella]
MTGRRKRGRPRRGEGPALDDLDVMLAREFQQRPAFYDRTHPQYRNRDYLDGMWMDMAESVGQNVAIVKNRMVQLRNRYNLEKRRVEMLQDQYNDPSITSQWPMYNYLTYLGGHIKARRSFTKEVVVRPKSAPFSNSRPVRFAYCSDSDGCDESNQYPPCPPVAAAAPERQLASDLPNNSNQQNRNINYNEMQPTTPDKEEDLNFNPNPNFCKFRAFGQFLTSSLIEMNQCDALHLVEKFTTDLVKSLLLETHNKTSVEGIVNGHM